MKMNSVDEGTVSWMISHLQWVRDNSEEDYRVVSMFSPTLTLHKAIGSLKVREMKMLLEELGRLFGEDLVKEPIHRLETVQGPKVYWEGKLKNVLTNPILKSYFSDHKQEGYSGASRILESMYVCTYSNSYQFKKKNRQSNHVVRPVLDRSKDSVSDLSVNPTSSSIIHNVSKPDIIPNKKSNFSTPSPSSISVPKEEPKSLTTPIGTSKFDNTKKAFVESCKKRNSNDISTSYAHLSSMSSPPLLSDSKTASKLIQKRSIQSPNNVCEITPLHQNFQHSSAIIFKKPLVSKRSKIKDEDLVDEDMHTPKNTRESELLDSLRPIGFASDEILSAVRANKHLSMSTSIAQQSESLMIWMITQREEADEARKLDEARIQSENANAETSASREAVESTLQFAAVNEIFGETSKESFFKSSIVIQSNEMRVILKKMSQTSSKCKQLVIQYMLLEQKAIKWYGTRTPRAYFYWEAPEAFSSMKQFDEKEVKAFLDCQIQTLHNAFFRLDEQSGGGVPKLFLESLKRAKFKGQVYDDLASDDEVQILDDYVNNISNHSPKRKRRNISNNSKLSPLPIIEIT